MCGQHDIAALPVRLTGKGSITFPDTPLLNRSAWWSIHFDPIGRALASTIDVGIDPPVL